MRPLTIFRHIACEGPAYLAEVLDHHAVPWRLVKIDAGEPVPDTLDDCSGLVFMGGPMSVNDPLPWIEQELALIRRAQAGNMPVLGHCLGGQLICKALGGTISANPVKEIGWHPREAHIAIRDRADTVQELRPSEGGRGPDRVVDPVDVFLENLDDELGQVVRVDDLHRVRGSARG